MTPRKKILFLTHWYPNVVDTHRGIFIQNHARSINLLNDVLVVDFSIRYGSSLYKKKIVREKDEKGMDVLLIDIQSRFYKVLYYWLSFQYYVLKKALKKEQVEVASFDIIQSNVVFPSGMIGLKLSSQFKVPLVHLEHWSYVSEFLNKSVHKRKAAHVFEKASKVLVVSSTLAKLIEDHVDLKKVDIVPNIVNSHFSYMEKEADNKETTFLAVANWRNPKNPFLFLDAIESILQDGTPFKPRMVLVGEGVFLKKIKSNNYSFPIEFVGIVENKKLSSFFKRSDYFLHGSDFETFSIVTIEALMTGTPVIGSKVGVLPDVITTKNGILCDSSLDSWKDGIKKALETPYNFKSISESVSNKFSEEAVAIIFDEIYKAEF